MTEEYDINAVQASLTASKVLVAILETIGEVRVETKTLVGAENKDLKPVCILVGPLYSKLFPNNPDF